MPAPGLGVGERLEQIASRSGSDPAIIGVRPDSTVHELTWADLDRITSRRAQALRRDLSSGANVLAVPAENTVTAVVKIVSALRAELTVWPISPQLRATERSRRFTAAARQFGAVALDEGDIHTPAPRELAGSITGSRPRTTGYVLETGGTTGTPKLVRVPGEVRYSPERIPDALERGSGWHSGQRQLIVGPLHHAASFTFLLHGILDANTIVLQQVFHPGQTVHLIDATGVGWLQVTPTHLKAMTTYARPQPTTFHGLTGLLHLGARCDPATKRTWLDLVGPHRLFESYGTTEGIGVTLVRGDEWLARPGTVGRGLWTQIKILDDTGGPVPTGAVGEVYLRRTGRAQTSTHTLRLTANGFASVGDFGRLDDQSYLYIVSRREDMMIVGGENVYPEEVEDTLSTHPAVADCAVVGVSDGLLGDTVGAIVRVRDGHHAEPAGIIAFLRRHLAPHKVPVRVRIVDTVPRTPVGKIARLDLARLLRGQD
jgi:bile acid-coenzyme A ligase